MIKEEIYTVPLTGELIFTWSLNNKNLTLRQSECDPVEIIDKRKGDILKAYRTKFNLTQEAAAKEFNVSQAFISNYEKGKTYSDKFWNTLLKKTDDPIESIRWVMTGKNQYNGGILITETEELKDRIKEEYLQEMENVKNLSRKVANMQELMKLMKMDY